MRAPTGSRTRSFRLAVGRAATNTWEAQECLSYGFLIHSETKGGVEPADAGFADQGLSRLATSSCEVWNPFRAPSFRGDGESRTPGTRWSDGLAGRCAEPTCTSSPISC